VKPFIRHLRAFGYIAYIYLKGLRVGLEKPRKSQKMNPRAVKEYLVGYEGLREYLFKIWLLEKKVVVRARDIRFFDEDNNNDEDIQYFITFKEVREEDDKIEKEILPRFTLNKSQINKKNAGSVNNHQTTSNPQSQASKHPHTSSEHEQQEYLPTPSHSELPEPPKEPHRPPLDSADDSDEFFEPEEPKQPKIEEEHPLPPQL
jgi:hypothetical protein